MTQKIKTPAKEKQEAVKYRTLMQKFQNARGLRKWWEGTKLVVIEFLDDQCMAQAAAISYYTLLSIFPLILGIAAIGSLLINDPIARAQVIISITQAIPETSRTGVSVPDLVNGFLDTLEKNRGWLSVFSVLVALWSGTGIFDQIMNSANLVFEIHGDKRNFFYKVWLRFVMLFGLGGVLLISFLFGLTVDIIKGFSLFGINARDFGLGFDIVNFLTPTLLTWLALAILYWLAPDYKKISWKALLLGALIGAIFLQVARFGLGYYITNFNGQNSYAVSYGTLAGVIIFIFYIYVSAAILLFGMEIVAIASGVRKHNTFEKAYQKMKVSFEFELSSEQDKPSEVVQRIASTPKRNSNPLTMVLGVLIVLLVALAGRRRR